MLTCFTLSSINLDIRKAKIYPCDQEIYILMHETSNRYFKMMVNTTPPTPKSEISFTLLKANYRAFLLCLSMK